MKVNGQLEVAQLEQIASASPTPTPTGRVYADITTPTAAVPRFYNGTAWVPLTLGQATSTVSQNSGQAVTVNWATGLNQMVVLTANTVISFANPVPGSVHNLIVMQAAGPTVYRYTLNMIDQAVKRGAYQPIGVIPPNDCASYSWFYQAGVKAALATMPAANTAPLTAPPTLITGMDLSPDGKTLAYGRTSSPFSATYDVTDNWYGGVAPLGLQNISTPATLAAQAGNVSYAPDGKSVFFVSGTTPFLQGYLTNRGIATTVYANPVTVPAGAAFSLNIHPTGYFVGVGHATPPFMSVYPNLGGLYGTKLTNPVTLPAALLTGIAWSSQGDYLTGVSQTSPFIQTWAFTQAGSTGTIGAQAANPSVLPTGGPGTANGRSVAWRPQGDFIAMANSVSPNLFVVPFNRVTGAYGTPLTVTNVPAAASTCVAWSPDGQFLLVGCGTTPFLYIYDFSSFLLNTNVTLTANPGQQVNDIVVHPNGETVFLALNAGVFIISYQMPTKVRNYLRLTGP